MKIGRRFFGFTFFAFAPLALGSLAFTPFASALAFSPERVLEEASTGTGFSPAGSTQRDAAPADGDGWGVEFGCPRTVAEAGRTRVISFRVASPPKEAATLPFNPGVEGILEVVRPPTVEPGRAMGFVRIRGLRPGRATLDIGGAFLSIEVVEPSSRVRGPVPRITGPTDQAVIWGAVAVGVEMWVEPGMPLEEVRIRVGGSEVRSSGLGDVGSGVWLEAKADSRLEQMPYRQLLYELDARTLPGGMLELAAVSIDAAGARQVGDAIHVRLVHPKQEDLSAGEAEAAYDLERPPRFSDVRPSVAEDEEASGGACFVNAAAYPAVCFPLSVAAPGWYQVMLTARGERAAGALPTVGVVIDGEDYSRTNAPLLSERWHRLAVGLPLHLEPGKHVITPFFANDFYVPQAADRNLFLDRIEMARVADSNGGGATEVAVDLAQPAATVPMMSSMMSPALDDPAHPSHEESAAMGREDDPYGVADRPLRVAFVRPLEGAVLPGLFEIEGLCWWKDFEHRPAPIVTLMVNGQPAMSQRSAAPTFWVDPSFFTAGENRVQLVAELSPDVRSSTPIQRAFRPAEVAAAPLEARRHLRFSIHDDQWDPAIQPLLQDVHNPKERRAAALYSNGEMVLNLAKELAGSFQIRLYLMGDPYDGAPIAKVALHSANGITEVEEVEAPRSWSLVPVGPVELAEGDKQLVIGFINDKYDAGKGDRNLFLQAVLLDEAPKQQDVAVPWVAVRYPPSGSEVYLADAVVAEASDNASLASAELLVDGAATGLTADLNRRPGRFVLPLLARALPPGEHQVAVQVKDVAGNRAISDARVVRVLAEKPVSPGVYDRAARLLNRFAYGPDEEELAAILTLGETQWLSDRLEKSLDDPGEQAAFSAPFALFPHRQPFEAVRRAIGHLAITPNPVRARFVLWAQNHFSTWIRKVEGIRKWDEHLAFSHLGAARFSSLLETSAQSPAMIAYLDQEISFAGRLNENYAREIMELHTLGVNGGYTQADVTNLAQLFTGWSDALEGDGRGGGPNAQRYTFRFDPRLNNGSQITVAGLRFPEATPAERYDRIKWALEMLASHPSTAQFVSRSLAEHYIAAPAPQTLVDDLAKIFQETGGDMAELLRAIAQHSIFWENSQPDKVASALDYSIRLCRVSDHVQPWQVADFLQRSGQGLFDRPTPDGYPEDDSGNVGSNATLQRWRLAGDLRWRLVSLVPGGWRANVPQNATPEWRQRIVDLIAVRITGRVLDEASNQAALDLLASLEGAPGQRVLQLAPFIAALPEANLR